MHEYVNELKESWKKEQSYEYKNSNIRMKEN